MANLVELELVWDLRCEVSEGPVWDEGRQRIWFADLFAGRVHAFGIADGARLTWDMPDRVGSLGLCRSGRLVVALRDRVVLLDPDTGAITPFTAPFPEPATSQLNDGKIGPDGSFWVGSTDQRPVREPIASLYRVTPDGQVERKSTGYVTSNGLAWSADGRTMFHSDSNQRFIEVWDFDPPTGAISRQRRIAEPSVADGKPDGAACDMAGGYWSAGVTAGCLNRFSATGDLLAKIQVSTPAPTMPCFAGPHLYLTSLRRGRDPALIARFPGAGGLYRMPAPAKGVEVHRFAD